MRLVIGRQAPVKRCLARCHFAFSAERRELALDLLLLLHQLRWTEAEILLP
jgi:hypothetical protein